MAEPLTDEQLKMLLAFPLKAIALAELERREGGTLLGIPITHLVAEVRRLRHAHRMIEETLAGPAKVAAELDRLRSDEWLRAAVEEFGLPSGADAVARQHFADVVMPILRKHRDGKP